MKKISIFLLTIFTFSNVYAAGSSKKNSYIGEGRIQGHKNAPPSLIQSLLLQAAFRDVIDRYLRKNSLNAKLFWNKYDNNFQINYGDQIEIKKNYHISLLEKSKNRNISTLKNKLNKDYRLFHSKLKKTYFTKTKLKNVIQSYVVKRKSRSSFNANVLFIRIEAQINQKLINRIYYQSIDQEKNRIPHTLVIINDIVLDNNNWSKLGVLSQSGLTNILLKHWSKYFRENQSPPFKTILTFPSYLNQSIYKITNGQEVSPSEKDGILSNLKNTEVNLTQLKNALILHISFKIENTFNGQDINLYTFRFSGEISLFDIYNQNSVWFNTIKETEIQFRSNTQTQLNSSLATELYNLPIKYLSNLKNQFENLRFSVGTANIILQLAPGHIGDVFKFQKLLDLKGMGIGLKSQLVTVFPDSRYLLKIHHNGQNEQLKKMLLSLNNQKLNSNKVIAVTDGIPIKFLISEKVNMSSTKNSPKF
ncbi:hypothetical protein OAB57_01495 [Bacteriovoracaceae bacterium]|nr:hypothetical protein [Bacteriovoracaceae bacterium]